MSIPKRYLDQAAKTWEVGDVVAAFKGDQRVGHTIVSIEHRPGIGNILTLSNGQRGHWSRVRLPRSKR